MGTYFDDILEPLPYLFSFTVHRSMCTELMKLVDRVGKVFPEIEEARPRCSSGIQALCLLSGTLEKAKKILRYCCESSKLYLVITGDVIVSRCERSKSNFEQSLGQIQTMVPPPLADEISQVIDDLTAAKFMMDSSDAEAGKAMRELIQRGTSTSDSVEYSEIKALQIAASRLLITTPRAIIKEKSSIKKLLGKVGDNDPSKKKILKYLLYLLRKYGDLIMEEQQTENPKPQLEGSVEPMKPSNDSADNSSVETKFDKGVQQLASQTGFLTRGVPPEEFKCPISRRVMFDPVVISSGQTFERVFIQNWFDEGNETCPKTKEKLPHCSLTPNKSMKELISKWCERYGIMIPDPSIQVYQSLDMSSTSIASLGSSMNDLHLPVDISSVSIGSLDGSYTSDSSRLKYAGISGLISRQHNDDSHKFQARASGCEEDPNLLTNLSELHWDSQCKMIDNVKSHLQDNDRAFHSMSSENFVEPLIRFLRTAYEQRDARAQRAGSQLLFAFVSKNRSGIFYLPEEAFNLLVDFLDSEVIAEALYILEVLSSHPEFVSKITASGTLIPILKILDSQSKEFQEQGIKILHNLSSDSNICSQMVYLDFIPKLVPFIKDSTVARYCMVLLKNLCEIEEARVAVAETNGCIAAMAELLESGGQEEQEHTLAVLLSLCSQRIQYCKSVMDEGIIPSLVVISVNGSDKAKVAALELLRQLRDIDFSEKQESFPSDIETSRDPSQRSKETKSSSKTSGFLKNFVAFSKPSSKKKR